MRVAFHSNQLGLRGTEVALFDYALYNEEILGNESMIISDANADLSGLQKFQDRFRTMLYSDFSSQVPYWVDGERIDVLYCLKAGHNDGKFVSNAKTVVHSVFQYYEPHGQVYAYISNWLARKMGGPSQAWVPHIVDILRYDHSFSYREQLNIPDHAVVFGYYGGLDSFNIEFARRAVVDVARLRSDVYFLFMNIRPFCAEPNVLFFDGTTDLRKKIGFINACDSCLHARNGGESFGLTVAEFSSKNRPVITTSYSTVPRADLAHLEMLGDKALIYNSYESLTTILLNFRDLVDKSANWNAYEAYNSRAVMSKFAEVFL